MKKTHLMIVLLLSAALAAGCGQTNKQPENGNSAGSAEAPTAVDAKTAGDAKSAATPVEKKLAVKIYFTDDQMMDLKEQTVEISYAQDADKYLTALEALKNEDAAGSVSLWENAVFHTAALKDGMLTVDMSLPAEARLGAPGEELALEAIQKTAFQFDEVKSLDLLVDGKAVESLMGHVDLDHPIVKP
jgi:hypothetical protein